MSKSIIKIIILFSFFLIIANFSQAQVQKFEIWEIQGNITKSPLQNQTVRTDSNIVTAIRGDGFFIQSPDSRADESSLTSNGVWVKTGFRPNFRVGNMVNVEGRIIENDFNTQLGPSNLNITLVNNDIVALPTSTPLSANFPSEIPKAVPDLEQVEGMLVHFDGVITGPMDFAGLLPVASSKNRPFREPGIRFPGLADLPVWDGNPELFWFDPDAFDGLNNKFLGGRMEVNSSGVLVQDEDRYVFWAKEYAIQGTAILRPVRAKERTEITVASLNTEVLTESNNDYLTKLKKAAIYITDLLKTPDILSLQEVGSLGVLEDLILEIARVNPDAEYIPYFLKGNGGFNVGFLTSSNIIDVELIQLGVDIPFQSGKLHDRPPLLLKANINTVTPIPIHVMNLHLRSLIDIEGSSREVFVRTKRHQQSMSVAQFIQDYRDKNLVVVGDFNAFEFSDGYVDVVNQITGQNSIGAEYPATMIVDPPLRNLTAELDAEERYSFVFNGNAQLLDHCLSDELTDFEVIELQFARANADNSNSFEDNNAIAHRTSDHDGFVLFLKPKSPISTSTNTFLGDVPTLKVSNPHINGTSIEIKLQNSKTHHLEVISTNGRILFFKEIDQKFSQVVLPSLSSGIYIVRLSDGRSHLIRKIVVK